MRPKGKRGKGRNGAYGVTYQSKLGVYNTRERQVFLNYSFGGGGMKGATKGSEGRVSVPYLLHWVPQSYPSPSTFRDRLGWVKHDGRVSGSTVYTST